jgi:hypothetical protein
MVGAAAVVKSDLHVEDRFSRVQHSAVVGLDLGPERRDHLGHRPTDVLSSGWPVYGRQCLVDAHVSERAVDDCNESRNATASSPIVSG